MVSITDDEEEIVAALAACLSIAISRAGDVDASALNRTKTQKLFYLAIDEFDLPVTYCWYLAGSFVESSTVDPSSLETDMGHPPSASGGELPTDTSDANEGDETAGDADAETADSSPRPADLESELAREFEMTTSDHDRPSDDGSPAGDAEDDDSIVADEGALGDVSAEVPDPDADLHPSDISVSAEIDFPAEDVVSYLQSRLSAYPMGSTDEFLLHFYHHHAPGQYRELYESSLHIRSELRSITQQLRRAATDGGSLDGLEEKIDRIGDHVTAFHFNLAEHAELRPTTEAVLEATNVIEDALMMVQRLPADDVAEEHVAAFEELQSFFYEYAWKYPTLKIASLTATGPSAQRVRKTRDQQFNRFESTLANRREDVIRDLADAVLRPSPDAYPEFEEDEMEDAITDLYSNYMSNSESE